MLGVGIDLCELDRIEGLLRRMGDQFLRRAYNPDEIAYILEGPTRARRCAGLFAAKEAVVKCLGTGFASGVGWKSVEVVPAGPARPVRQWLVKLHGEAALRGLSHGSALWSVDIQYDREHAAAIAIWSRAQETDCP